MQASSAPSASRRSAPHRTPHSDHTNYEEHAALIDAPMPIPAPRRARPESLDMPQPRSEEPVRRPARPTHRDGGGYRPRAPFTARASTKPVPDLPASRGVFIPPQRPGTTRSIPLSDTAHVSMPMIAVRYMEETYIVGSGLDSGSVEFPGVSTVMPDVRILLPIRETIKAWFLTECRPEMVEGIVPLIVHLDFPPIYAYESVIEKIRTLLVSKGFGDRADLHVMKAGFDRAETVGDFTFRSFPLSSREHRSYNSARYETPNGRVLVLEPEPDPIQLSDILGPLDLVFTGPHDDLSAEVRERLPLVHTQKIVCVDPHENFDRNPAFSVRPTEIFARLQHGNIIDVTEHQRIDVHAVRLFLDTFVVDSVGIGTASSHVLQARAQMQTSGVAVVAFPVDRNTRAIIGLIRIETRGLAHAHEIREVHRYIIKIARTIYEQTIKDIPDIDERDLGKILKTDLEKALQTKFKRSPMVIPVIMGF
ncbi:MAG TPA: hypothetical protein PK765_03765 [bacterium]|nr:hypothetical protein [bacterium]